MQVKSSDTIPIKYDPDHPWGTITTAITTRNTDEAKSFRKEIASYIKGVIPTQ